MGVGDEQEAEGFLVEVFLVFGGLLCFLRDDVDERVDDLLYLWAGVFHLHELFIEPGYFGEVGGWTSKF